MRNKKVVPKILDGRYFEIISVDAQQISNSSERFHKVQHHTMPLSAPVERLLVLLDKSKDRDAIVSTMRHLKKFCSLNPTALYDLYGLTGESILYYLDMSGFGVVFILI